MSIFNLRKFLGKRNDSDAVILPGFPAGHFYSPVVDIQSVRQHEEMVWRPAPEVPGVEFNDHSHRHLLENVFPLFMGDYDYPENLEENAQLSGFFSGNSQFGWLDCRALFVMVRHCRPRKIIEIGGGFSSLLTADINHRFLDDTVHFTCIEPYPREFLQKEIPGLTELKTERVEDLPLTAFSDLVGGDILFIDSSHVSKTNSDVNYLVFEVLPRLRPGVLIHIHDIFLPNEYPREWVLEEGRSWNEQYIIRALLMFSTAFRIVFGSSYAFCRHPELVASALNLPSGNSFGGSSLWIERI